MRRALVAANWKMHGSRAEIEHYLASLQVPSTVDVALFPPAVYLPTALQHAPQGLACGVQDVGRTQSGAHTGDVSAAMVADIGGRWAIVGHSERRQYQGESDALVAQKARAATEGGLRAIVCVGETLEERQAGEEQAVVGRQLDAILAEMPAKQLMDCAIGYEPVWAIGTGETATPEQAQAMHGFIRAKLEGYDAAAAQATRIVYGGSVKPANAAELFSQPDIDGGLVGGASMDAQDFSAILAAAAQMSGDSPT